MGFNAGVWGLRGSVIQGADSMLPSGRTTGSPPLKWPLLSKEMSPLELLVSRTSLAAQTPRQIPTVPVPAHSTQEACGQTLGTLAVLPCWGLDIEKPSRAAREALQTSQERTSRASPAGPSGMPECIYAVSDRQERTPQGV